MLAVGMPSWVGVRQIIHDVVGGSTSVKEVMLGDW